MVSRQATKAFDSTRGFHISFAYWLIGHLVELVNKARLVMCTLHGCKVTKKNKKEFILTIKYGKENVFLHQNATFTVLIGITNVLSVNINHIVFFVCGIVHQVLGLSFCAMSFTCTGNASYITAVMLPILIKDIIKRQKCLYSDNSTDLFEHKHFLNTQITRKLQP